MRRTALLSLGLMSLAACAGTPAGLAPRAVEAVDLHKGYLDKASLEALAATLPSPPAKGSMLEAADHHTSQGLRRFENTDRWLIATSHAEVRLPMALQHFDCALGVRFTPQDNRAPATSRLLQKLFEDAEAASTMVKLREHRARPVGDDPEREACQRVSPAGRNSPSYPSGTATVAGAYGEAMAAIAPDSAEAAREIGRQIALSRVICGMHYPFDVRVGHHLGKMVFENAVKSPEFATDLVAAKEELAALRARNETNPACAAERRALAMTEDLSL